ncbi:MAG TPA: leucine--tRNA ligase [Patescibacteria group bacterium]|jgi:leucyl-tRNA synthetase
MKRYDPQSIEPKWQEIWEKTGVFKTPDEPKDKQYVLDMFPYPSADGLHTGHPRGYTATDVFAHYRRFTGHDVLHPIGWDAFGLPAENAAIKKGVHPAENTAQNIENFRRQLKRLGYSYDWDREVNTSDPDYYKWTQWIFTELFKAGLVYRAAGQQWWCPKDKTVLANEQVVDGRCERCGSEVTKKELTQWYFKITEYADELIDSLDELDWPEPIKAMQRNWIGRSEGLLFSAPVKDMDLEIQTFSAHYEAFRADTFVVIAPDHPLLPRLIEDTENEAQVRQFCDYLIEKRIKRGFEEEKESEGIFTGRYVVDPVGNGELPIWVASYALADYGTGIVKCSAHDERDFKFAKKYRIPLKAVLMPKDAKERRQVEAFEECYTDFDQGVLTEPEELAGKRAHDVSEEVKGYAEKHELAKRQTQYKLRDWLISRQRYWGTPIPIIHCDKCGPQPVAEKGLPVELPDVKDYLPTGDGRSPLAKVTDFVKTTCPKCGGPAERETDTMDTFADSNWYFLRYPNPRKEDGAFDKEALRQWLPVDMYVGGAEHAVLHLLYARFWTKALADRKYLGFREPFKSLRNQGLIMAEDGRKMSKSLGNVVNPDDVIKAFGADTLRLFELFIGPFDQPAAWDTKGIEGSYRFLKRVWAFGQGLLEAPDGVDQETDIAETGLERAVSKATKRITSSIEQFRFNTAVSGLMEALNGLQEQVAKTGPHAVYRPYFERYLILLSPFAPHLAEELWHELGHEESIFTQDWPTVDESAIKDETVPIPVQVNGKLRATLELPADGLSEAVVTEAALSEAAVKKHLAGKPKKAIYINGKLLNLVG